MTIPPAAQPGLKISVRLFNAPTAQSRRHLKILLLKLGERIGDFVVAIDAFRIIREAFPGAEITLICLPSIVSLAESTGLFNRVAGFSYIYDVIKEGKVPKMDSTDQIAGFTSLLDGPYFLAADFRHDGSTRPWLDYVQAECRAGFTALTQKGLDIALPVTEWDVPTGMLDSKNLPLHTELRLTLLAHAIVDALLEKQRDADLFHLPEDLSEVESYRTLSASPQMKVGVCLGAGSQLRQWPVDYWVALMQRLITAHNARIVFFGGLDDKEEAAAVIARLPADHIVDLTGAVALAFVPAYMNLLDAYIGCDTGMTHLAGSLAIPTVNIFAGISNVSVWRSRGPKVKTVYAEVACAPCHLRVKTDCPNSNICMTAIVPDIVYACFQKAVAAE